MTLPFDSHVHSEFSWDVGGPMSPAAGLMGRLCERAGRLGIPGLAFTDHLDLGDWPPGPQDTVPYAALISGGRLRPPALDLEGYLDSVERCRHRYPDLVVLTGVELGQPHLSFAEASMLVDLSNLGRFNGSLHTLPDGDDRAEPNALYARQPAEEVVSLYLEEMVRMVAGPEAFGVVTHLDYAVRTWPTQTAGPFDVHRFEDGFRRAMRAIADSGRALEMSAARLQPWMPRWWADEGGEAVTVASDAHEPDALGVRFDMAVAMIEAAGFEAGRRPEDLWRRRRPA